MKCFCSQLVIWNVFFLFIPDNAVFTFSSNFLLHLRFEAHWFIRILFGSSGTTFPSKTFKVLKFQRCANRISVVYYTRTLSSLRDLTLTYDRREFDTSDNWSVLLKSGPFYCPIELFLIGNSLFSYSNIGTGWIFDFRPHCQDIRTKFLNQSYPLSLKIIKIFWEDIPMTYF